MRIFFDTEFTGLHQDTTLISIGLIAENNYTFYAEFTDYALDQVTPWIQDNVIHNLAFDPESKDVGFTGPIGNPQFTMKGDKCLVRDYLAAWFNSLGSSPHELWSDVLAYDWVLFCDLWGSAHDIPETVYYIPLDLATLFMIKGINPDISRTEFADMEGIGKGHNALFDARVIKACYERLMAE